MNGFRIGIVGCGGIANRHIAGYRNVAHDLGEVVAGCDIDKDALNRYCDRYDLPHRFTNAADMIASGEVDVISLLTPPAVRQDVIFAAIDRGIHLLVEKPFGESLRDAVSFVEAAERAGVTLAVNHQLGFMEDVVALRRIVDAGTLGETRYISHDELKNRTRVRGWRTREQRLEISIFSIHLIDRIRTLAGSPPQKISATTRHWNPEVKGETFASLIVQFENGIVGTMISNWHALTLPECRLRIDGTTGSALSVKRNVLSDEATLQIHPLNREPETRTLYRKDAFTHAMGESMNHLLDAARRGAEPIHSGRGNLYTMQIVDAAYLSAERGGEMVAVDEVL